MGRGIKLSEIAERMDLKNLTPELDLTEKKSMCRTSTDRRFS